MEALHARGRGIDLRSESLVTCLRQQDGEFPKDLAGAGALYQKGLRRRRRGRMHQPGPPV